MILHMLTNVDAWPSLLKVAASDDTVLLIDAGVYCAATSLELKQKKINMVAYKPDVITRGLSLPEIKLINDEQWLALVIAHKQCITW